MRVRETNAHAPMLLLLGAILLSGCAHTRADVTPADIPRLEAEVRAKPGDTDLRTRLGIGQYKAGEYDLARMSLSRAVADGATTGAALLHLGLANEALDDWAGAREAYARYVEVGRFDRLRNELQDRMTLVIRNELVAESRAALQRESELTAAPPTPRTIAVFPFRLISDNPDFEPLRYALASMIITDLSLSGSVRVLERSRIQALLDEMALTEAGYTEPGTGARAGRLLSAEHIVQGAVTLTGSEGLRFDTDVLRTEEAASAGAFTNEDTLDRLFELEKELVFGILDVLGVSLTPAEREAINERWTENLMAFLAYGSGLRAKDAGDFAAASTFFRQAAELDPSFSQAQAEQDETAQLQQASEISASELSFQAMEDGLGMDLGMDIGLPQSPDSDFIQAMVEEVNPSRTTGMIDLGTPDSRGDRLATDRNPIQEASGTEGVGQTSTFTIILRITRPEGE